MRPSPLTRALALCLPLLLSACGPAPVQDGGPEEGPPTGESGQEMIKEYLQTKSVWISTATEVPNPFVMR